MSSFLNAFRGKLQTLSGIQKSVFLLFTAFNCWFWLALPYPLFRSPTSTLLRSREGDLLSAIIAADGQWRFPASEGKEVPEKFTKAIIEFEDRHFRYHPGVDPAAVLRAFLQNIEAGEVVSGGSTLSMQVMRLALTANQGSRSRSFWNKLVETLLAMRLELAFSKEEIVQLYAANAPFGGNVVGLEAAAWRYFGRKPGQLSWGEMATLAVLPNAPSLIYPGKNQSVLLEKRNRLLDKLWQAGELDSLSNALAKLEPLPQQPYPLPQKAFHLLNRAVKEGYGGKLLNSTLHADWQAQVTDKVAQHSRQMALNEIHNAAALVIDIRSNEVLAYVGNSPNLAYEHSPAVDIIGSPRSTGSILKPFLFAAAQEEGLLLPQMLIPDVPSQFAGYVPENFDRTFRGAVPANKALAWSLNIPAVRLLQEYSYDAFLHKLRKLGVTTMPKPADHYGLTLILGGAEANLWELTSMYAGMVRTVESYTENNGRYFPVNFAPPAFHVGNPSEEINWKEGSEFTQELSAGACYLTLQALQEVTRPDEQQGWQNFDDTQAISWKTGTSFGHRDAWAIGVTADYAVGVWVGNADGEGRPGLVGTQAAAPLLFDIFRGLPASPPIPVPYDDLQEIQVCSESGYRAGRFCPDPDSALVALGGLKAAACPFHQLVHTDQEGRFRVSANCRKPSEIKTQSWLVLPPLQEWYYKRYHPAYRPLPPFAPGCQTESQPNMAVIYPPDLSRIFIPKEMDGQLGKVIFEVAHRKPDQTIFWHLNETFLGKTTTYHKMELQPASGEYSLILIDENGEELQQKVTFEVSGEARE